MTMFDLIDKHWTDISGFVIFLCICTFIWWRDR